MADDKEDDGANEGTAKPRKLVLTKRVLRQFGVRSGVQTGLNDYGEPPGDYPDPPQNYQAHGLYRTGGTSYYG